MGPSLFCGGRGGGAWPGTCGASGPSPPKRRGHVAPRPLWSCWPYKEVATWPGDAALRRKSLPVSACSWNPLSVCLVERDSVPASTSKSSRCPFWSKIESCSFKGIHSPSAPSSGLHFILHSATRVTSKHKNRILSHRCLNFPMASSRISRSAWPFCLWPQLSLIPYLVSISSVVPSFLPETLLP